MKDEHGLDANDQAKMEQKKRGSRRVGDVSAHAPDELSVESDDFALIASCPTSVPKALAGSGTVNSSPRPGDAAPRHAGDVGATRMGAPIPGGSSPIGHRPSRAC